MVDPAPAAGAAGGVRPTPYELVFAHALFEDELFPEIGAELDATGLRSADPETFVRLRAVGAVIDRLIPRDPASPGAPAPAAALAEHARLLFHAWHYWRHEGTVHTLAEAATRALLSADAVPAPAGPLLPPAPAGYAQLPVHLVWARLGPDLAPEPVDGFFWTMIGRSAPSSPPFDRLDVLLVLGVRAGRAGFSISAAGGAVGADAPAEWELGAARPDGDDFANILPGGELRGLHALVSAGETLKLASRFLRSAATGSAVADG